MEKKQRKKLNKKKKSQKKTKRQKTPKRSLMHIYNNEQKKKNLHITYIRIFLIKQKVLKHRKGRKRRKDRYGRYTLTC